MNRNVEIKACVDDCDATRARIESLADRPAVVLEQTDTLFECGSDRLKLRPFGSPGGELIYVSRRDRNEPAESRCIVHRTSKPASLRETLAEALGVRGTVRKRRSVYFIGHTRVDLDRVERLGDFAELEGVMEPDQAASQGVEITRTLMERLGISEEQLVAGRPGQSASIAAWDERGDALDGMDRQVDQLGLALRDERIGRHLPGKLDRDVVVAGTNDRPSLEPRFLLAGLLPVGIVGDDDQANAFGERIQRHAVALGEQVTERCISFL
jgi:adenylate cyclase class IV